AEPGDLTAYVLAAWHISADMNGYVEAVHRLDNFGALVTLVVHGKSHEGFDAEWRELDLFTFEGDRISRLEIFDDSDLDAALARFDELQPQAPRVENAATQMSQRFNVCFAARDWAAMAELLS